MARAMTRSREAKLVELPLELMKRGVTMVQRSVLCATTSQMALLEPKLCILETDQA